MKRISSEKSENLRNSVSKNKWLVILAVFIAFVALLDRMIDDSGLKKPKIREAAVSVEQVTTVSLKTTLDFIGTGVSNESVDVTSNISQKISQINFSDCQLVKKGDILVQLNTEKLKASKKQAEINLHEQQRELARLESLKKKKAVAIKDYDSQSTKLQNAQAKLTEIEEEIKEGTIVAPFDGILGLRRVSVGALLTPGTVITTLDDIKKIKVDFAVPEKYLPLISTGCPITVTSIAVADREFHGTVQAVSPRISPISRTLTVRGLIDNDEYLLRSGMLLNVMIQMHDREALMIPEESIVNVGEKHYAFVVRDGNIVKKQEITVGLRQKNMTEVTSGLTKNDVVIKEGVLKLSDGDKVRIVNSAETKGEA